MYLQLGRTPVWACMSRPLDQLRCQLNSYRFSAHHFLPLLKLSRLQHITCSNLHRQPEPSCSHAAKCSTYEPLPLVFRSAWHACHMAAGEGDCVFSCAASIAVPVTDRPLQQCVRAPRPYMQQSTCSGVCLRFCRLSVTLPEHFRISVHCQCLPAR